MKYHALAVDYDGTLASDGQVDDQTIAALRRLRESGRQLILVTGRIVDQLVRVFPQLGLCNLVVADNGALLDDPHTKERLPLDERPPPEFIAELQHRGVSEPAWFKRLPRKNDPPHNRDGCPADHPPPPE